MQTILGTSSTFLAEASQRPVIQNLGPGEVYITVGEEATASDGLHIAVGAVYEFPPDTGSANVNGIASVADTDVRIVTLGYR